MFRKVCAPMNQRVYTLKSPDHPHGDLELASDGQQRIHQLQVMLAGSADRCVRISGEVFDDE